MEQKYETTLNSNLPRYGLISAKEMLIHLPIKRSTLFKWVKEKRFPAPVKIHSLTRWRCVDVHTWLDQYMDTGV